MSIRLALILLVLGFLVYPTAASAQRLTNTRTATDSARTATDSGRQALVQNLRAAAQAQRDAAKQRLLEQKATARARFQQIRDERKLAILEKIEEQLGKINERITDHFLNVLDRLQAILAKIQSRSDRAEQSGKNVVSVDAAIASASAQIATAEAAVTAQMANTYPIQISSESAARVDVQTMMQQMRTDLKIVRDTVEEAKRAVHAAHQALRLVLGNEADGSPSATPAATTSASPAL